MEYIDGDMLLGTGYIDRDMLLGIEYIDRDMSEVPEPFFLPSSAILCSDHMNC